MDAVGIIIIIVVVVITGTAEASEHCVEGGDLQICQVYTRSCSP